MLQLIPFELGKIWRKQSFILSIIVLMSVHIFLLWYTSMPNEEMPPLSAYSILQKEISGLSEDEKGRYIEDLKTMIDGICFVSDIISMQGFQNEIGNILAEQEMQNNPGMFEKYYNLYQSGDYLRFTDSLEQEKVFIDEIYYEYKKVAEYGEYLQSIQENRDTLGKISVFNNKKSYSSRNIQKSADDYAHLTDDNICFTPSKGIKSAMQSIWIDFFLFLSVMMFVGSMIIEEKEKNLFFITRSTRFGILHTIIAKMSAMLIHCVLITSLFYMISIVFFGQSTGWFNPAASIQSLAEYGESSLSLNIFCYILISILTKAILLFVLGSLLSIFCIISGNAASPFLAELGIVGGSALMYYLIPSYSSLSVFKYINPVGIMKTENLYGGYLNFNLFGYPVSRLSLSIIFILMLCVVGTAGNMWLFCRMKKFEIKKIHMPFSIPFRPHTNIFLHEAYKILVINGVFVIILIFAIILGTKAFDHTYTPSVTEQYYQDIMKEIEGELTEEKEVFILSEKSRFEKAFEKINQINDMESAGSISSDVANALKSKASMVLLFYPQFQRVEKQYAHIKAKGGSFVYDTGFLYYFGVLEDEFAVYFLVLSIGIIFMLSGAVSMEYRNNSMYLLSATKAGKGKILKYKFAICIAVSAVLSIVPLLCRFYYINSVYPMHVLKASIRDIIHFSGFIFNVPVIVFILIFALSQILASVFVASVTFALSVWKKNQIQTIFFALLFLAVPVILKLLGFKIAGWFSFYPMYAWTGK